jgi:hypothetical protein
MNPHLSRGIHLIPLLALVDGMGAIVLMDWVKRIWRSDSRLLAKYFALILLIGLFSAVTLELSFRYKDYFTSYKNRADVRSYFRYGLEDALAYVRSHQSAYDEIWITDTNVDQPYIYLLFYSTWPPSDVHQNLLVRRAPPAFNEVDAFGKYHFGDLPEADLHDLVLLYRSQDSDGVAFYQVRGGVIPDRGRVLFLDQP